ncbi:MAG TPA: alpha/beta hydrolase, partial [Flavobacterium sp.]|nr:alpha/beta hydrolase [Flavobacterium sp.]
ILHFAQFPILLILGKLDPVLNFEECCTQVSNTKVNLVVFDDGHMSHIENRESLTQVLVSFVKGIR